MKIVTVVGARPQFIKAASVSRALRNAHTESIIHTGQHYDLNMSDIFFMELDIPVPNYNLSVGSGSHAFQTAHMMMGIEEILLKDKPDYILLYGDTNSTLAGALAASKIHIPIIHVEAGLRSFNMRMPEEQNRILTDRLSTLLFCPTQAAVEHLQNEGIIQGVHNVGDVMCDAVMYYSQNMEKYPEGYFWMRLKGLFGPVTILNEWYLATVHRDENTDSIEKVSEVLDAFERLNYPVIFPVHPRTRQLVSMLNAQNTYQNIVFVEPIGYLDMLFYTQYAKGVITDSGGLQKEAYILGTPCVTVREQTEWTETLTGNCNVLASCEVNDICQKVTNTVIDNTLRADYYGCGDASKKICEIIGYYSS